MIKEKVSSDINMLYASYLQDRLNKCEEGIRQGRVIKLEELRNTIDELEAKNAVRNI